MTILQKDLHVCEVLSAYLSEIKLKNTFYRTKANVAFAVTVSGELQISAFFLFSNFRKGRLPYIRPVGRLTSPLFFSIYTGIKALY